MTPERPKKPKKDLAALKRLSGELCPHGEPVEHNCLACWTRIILGR